MYTALFWIGFLMLTLVNGATLLGLATVPAAALSLVGAVLMFVGSKIGREFLGLA